MLKQLINKERIAWLLAILSLAALLLIQKCKNDPAEITSEINSYHTDTIKHEAVRGIDVATIHQALLETQDQMKELIKSNDTLRKLVKEFKTVNSITRVKTETFIKDSIRYKPIPCDFAPFSITKKTDNYFLKALISQSQLKIDSLVIPNEIQFIEGKRKTGLFKSEQQIMAVNSNPFVRTTEIQSLTIKTKKKWWEHPLFWMAVGVAGEKSAEMAIKAAFAK